jgi:hypothetical protein
VCVPISVIAAASVPIPAASIAIAESPSVAESVPAIEAAMPVSITPPSISPIPAIPRSRADEEPTHKPAWTVEAIGRAGIGIVAVIAVGADRRIAVSGVIAIPAIPVIEWTIGGAHPDTRRHLSRGRGHKKSRTEENSKQNQIPKYAHDVYLSSALTAIFQLTRAVVALGNPEVSSVAHSI